MGLFTKENRDVCYFCNNDYFKLFKTLDNNYVCKDCLGTESIDENEIMFMTLDDLIKTRETFTIGESKVVNHDTYCTVCNKKIGSGSKDYLSLNSYDYCKTCGSDKIKAIDKEIILTAGNELAGYDVQKHLDLVCVESLVSLGYNMNYESQSLLGRPSEDKDMKFKEAKNAAILKLKMEAFNLGGNAVLAVTISSSVFYDKRSVVATGTVVNTKKTNS